MGHERGGIGSTRVYKREWLSDVWRGSLAELIDASDAALDEMTKTSSQRAETLSLDLEYADSDQAFGSLDAMQAALDDGGLGDITGFHFDAQCENGFSVRVSGAARTGIHVAATGSEAFAIGMTGALKSRLSGGVEAGAEATRVAPDVVDLAGGAIIALLALAIGAFCLVNDLGVAVSALFAATAAGVGIQLASTTVWPRRDARKPPSFMVVSEGQQFPDEASQKGPLWSAKKWLDRHPGAGTGLGLAIGALLTRLASEINF